MDKPMGCGIDVSATNLVVVVQTEEGRVQQRDFANQRAGHKALVRWLQKPNRNVRVCLEATGVYSLDVARQLHSSPGIEVAVLNPKMVCRFAQTLRRSKTDPADAQVLCEYARRMPWQPWNPPPELALALRAVTRHWAALTQQHTLQQNRLHAAEASSLTPGCVRRELKKSLRQLESGQQRMQREAKRMVQEDAELSAKFTLLLSVPGIGETSALHLLGELMLLPAGLNVRQWVAHSGLDPAHHQSGTSVPMRSRISRAGSRNLRRALYMPALVALQHDPHLRGFYHALLGRNKRKLQALIAVARKILHAIFGMFKTQSAYDGRRLFPRLLPDSSA